jgi:hypothetical protein
MWRLIKKTCLAALALFVAIGISPGVRADDTIDPNKEAFIGNWKLSIVPCDITVHDGAKAFSDTLYFQPDDIMAEAFAPYGFVSDGYWTFEEGPMFCGMMSSNSKGSLYWQGVAVGNALYGCLIWTKTDGTVWYFTYTGVKSD